MRSKNSPPTLSIPNKSSQRDKIFHVNGLQEGSKLRYIRGRVTTTFPKGWGMEETDG